MSPPPSDISPAKPGPEAPDVRLRVDGDRDAGGLGGLGQHRYAAAPSPILTDATRRARSGSAFTSVLDAVIYVQAYRLHGGRGMGGGNGCKSGQAILAAVCHSWQVAHAVVTWALKMHSALDGYLSRSGGDEVHLRTLSACKRSSLPHARHRRIGAVQNVLRNCTACTRFSPQTQSVKPTEAVVNSALRQRSLTLTRDNTKY